MKNGIMWVLAVVVVLASAALGFGMPQSGSTQGDYIEGTVINSAGGKPEAGVWVIAETSSLPVPFRKMVVTNDEGKFVVPDLPKGDYTLWVRGYGLRDSAPVKASFGKAAKLEVANASSPQEAAQVYPADYWFSLWQPPAQDELPKGVKREEWIALLKFACTTLQQFGSRPTREGFGSCSATYNGSPALGHEVVKKSLADWRARIREGEVPAAPPRPTGVERNVVVTEWQWGLPNSFVHSTNSTDRRNPTLYPYGFVYAVDFDNDLLLELNPKTNQVINYKTPTRDGYGSDSAEAGHGGLYPNLETIYGGGIARPHNPMYDDKGNVWITMGVRDPSQQPKWATDVISTRTEAEREIAKNLVLKNKVSWNYGLFNIKTKEFVTIDTAFSDQHLQMDEQGRVWGSMDAVGLGMVDGNKLDPKNPRETEGKAQILYASIDTETGKSLSGGGYGIAVSPVDGTIWRASGSSANFGSPGGPGDMVGNALNSFDPKTQTFKTYVLPLGQGTRGVDLTSDGMVWFATRGTGQLGRLDPKTEKFTYWATPGPKIKGTGSETGSADYHYLIWTDQFNTLGLGKDIVVVPGSNSDSLAIFNPKTEKFTVLRVPYPMGFFTRDVDGRIDDANAGWKGRGLWANYSNVPTSFVEKTGMSNEVHIQVRPDPLAH